MYYNSFLLKNHILNLLYFDICTPLFVVQTIKRNLLRNQNNIVTMKLIKHYLKPFIDNKKFNRLNNDSLNETNSI